MELTIKKPEVKNVLLCIYFFFVCTTYLLVSVFDAREYLLFLRLVSAVFLLCIFLCQGKVYKQDLFIWAVIGCLILINGAFSINIVYILLCFFVLGKFDTDVLNKYILIFIGLVVAFVFFNILLGNIENVRWEYQGRVRYLLGFVHANYPGILSFSLVSMFLCLKKKLYVKDIVLSLVILFLVYRYTNSRTSFFVGVFCCLFYLFLSKINYRFIKWGVVLLETISFVSPLLWISGKLNTQKFNKLFSLRPQLYFDYAKQNGLREFFLGGSQVPENDSFYLVLLYTAGIFVYVFVAFLVVKATCYLFQKSEYMKVSFILSFIFLGWMESMLLRPEIISSLYFWALLYQNGFVALIDNYKFLENRKQKILNNSLSNI